MPGSPATRSFGFDHFDPLGPWDVRIHAWDDPAGDPPENADAFRRLLDGQPLLERTEVRLDWQWYTPRIEGIPQERWGLEATTRVDLPAKGTYSLRTISDDGIRI